jgi:acyl-CoA synthetase (AMP-forming)/AMP-acid ligase II
VALDRTDVLLLRNGIVQYVAIVEVQQVARTTALHVYHRPHATGIAHRTALGILDGKVIVPHKEYNGESYIFTRDIARMDRNGVMTFLSRSDRSITRFDGYKIKPYEVENIIKGYSDVQYCIISPVYDSEKFGNVAIADIILQDSTIPSREEQVKLIEQLIQKQFINNADVSARQIPAWFRFRESLPLTVNSKVNYNALAKEPLTGNEVAVQIEETNISVDKIIVR